jgi:signal transduction histidine kinase
MPAAWPNWFVLLKPNPDPRPQSPNVSLADLGPALPVKTGKGRAGAALYDDQQLLLAARPPSRLQRQWAYCVMACLVAAFCLAVPNSRLQLPLVAAFIPMQAAVIIVSDLIIATLIFAQFWIVRWTWLLILAGGFLFSGLFFIPYTLTFPEVFAPSGLLGAGLQTAAWISVFWRLGTPMVLITGMLFRGSGETIAICQTPPGRAIALSITLVTAIVCGLTWAILANDEVLPRIFHNGYQQYPSTTPAITLIITPIMALDAAALLLLWRRGRSVLDLWLMVMCCAGLFETSLGGLLAGSRYSVGWYTARTFQVVAIFTILLLLLSETTALYANMARAAIQRRGLRQARQLAMDATATAIGHEIKQPLTAIFANAEACTLRLKDPEPDLEALREAVADIETGCLRINQIIGDAQAMFKKSAHERKLLDVNKIIREVLAAVELDLRLQRVIVKTHLDRNLPPVLADGGQLHQVFLNLVVNALEAMKEAAARPAVLTIRSGIVADSSGIAVTVEDTGTGIADRDGARIFEPFFTTKASGSGVGLTICKVIIGAHGGKLQLGAKQGRGTIFQVNLPSGDDE